MNSCNRGCSSGWDVRCCCELNCPKKNTNEQFNDCPMKLNTIYFHIGNDYGLYNIAINNEWNIIKDYYNDYGVDVDIEQLKEWWDEDHIET